MDASRFDTLSKMVGTTDTRRGLLRLLAQLPLSAGLAALLGEGPDAGARKDPERGSSHRRHRRKARHRHDPGDDKDKNKRKDKRKGKRKKKRTGKRTGQDTGNGLTPCTPTTCAAQGKNCGTIADGCGGQLRCGPDTCGDGYRCTDHVCRCPDGTALCQGTCCQDGQVCQNGGGPCCTPNCARKCGGVADGCGGTCTGACDAGRVCLSNGTCAVPCPNGGADCGAAGCGNRCIGTNQGTVCSLGDSVGGCNRGNNADCPTGSACSGVICEPTC
jgi:hypothetical protein